MDSRRREAKILARPVEKKAEIDVFMNRLNLCEVEALSRYRESGGICAHASAQGPYSDFEYGPAHSQRICGYFAALTIVLISCG
jgi:hypothetical protein